MAFAEIKTGGTGPNDQNNDDSALKLTPMMKQYREMKEKYPDAILFFRLGDFYEMFFEDALEAARLLQITLTSRSKGDNKAPMCGVPYHAAEGYIAKLTRLGKKVAVCEQLTDPSLPGIVERDVVRVVTPGTTLDENILDRKSNNFIAAAVESDGGFDFAHADITTGEFFSTRLKDFKELTAETARTNPAEMILPEEDFSNAGFTALRKNFDNIFFFPFKTESADASSLLMNYLKSTQKSSLEHIENPRSYKTGDFVPIDEATLRNLEIVATLREGKKEGSVLWVLDNTATAMGGRMLKHFLLHPLLDRAEIDARLDAVAELKENFSLREEMQECLKSVMDLERLMSRLSLGRGNARDLNGLKQTLTAVPLIKNLLVNASSSLLRNVRDNADPLTDLTALIERAIRDDCPLSINEGGMIKDGYNSLLDEYRSVSRDGKTFINNLQREEIEKTGINNLKIKYNKVFGYFIEVSKGQTSRVPENYIRKQTLVNAERYITPELKEFEEKVLGAEEKIAALELKLFCEIRDTALTQIKAIKGTAGLLALVDVLASFALTALENRYCRPVISDGTDIEITGGRHPVIEKMSTDGGFVPNDAVLRNDGERILLITGPNMGGKSTFLRQTALIVLMAQIGSFVPAEKAVIGIVDRIFTRVGASDNLIKGQSTFMVEMKETSFILENASERSLIILDEVGRGTSTYDGMSIAWAIFEYIHDKIGAKTLFATHYHELIALAERLPRGANYAAAVSDSEEDGVVFLFKIIRGGVDRSYGIEVAKLAGLPDVLVSRANQILTDLEEGVLESGIQKELTDSSKRVPEAQLPIPSIDRENERMHEPIKANSTIEELKKVNLDSLTPLEALNKLASLKNNLE